MAYNHHSTIRGWWGDKTYRIDLVCHPQSAVKSTYPNFEFDFGEFEAIFVHQTAQNTFYQNPFPTFCPPTTHDERYYHRGRLRCGGGAQSV